jgi:hypothetical protein
MLEYYTPFIFWREIYVVRIFLKVLEYVIVLCTSCTLILPCLYNVTYGNILKKQDGIELTELISLRYTSRYAYVRHIVT